MSYNLKNNSLIKNLGVYGVDIIASGITAPILVIELWTYAFFMFSAYPGYLNNCIKLLIISTIALQLIICFFSRFKLLVFATVQSTAVVPIATMIAQAQQYSSLHNLNNEEVFFTVMVLIYSIGIITSLSYFIVSYFKLGNFIRFIPQIISVAFLATFSIMFIKVVAMMLNIHINDVLSGIYNFNFNDILLITLSSSLGLLLFIVSLTKYKKAYGITIMVSVILFYCFMAIFNIDAVQANKYDLFFNMHGAVSEAKSFFIFSNLNNVNIDMIIYFLPTVFSVILVIIFTSILDLSAYEAQLRQIADINYELKIIGAANLSSVFIGGGILGYHSLSKTIQIALQGAKTKLSIILISAFLVVSLYNPQIALILPKFVAVGISIFVSITLLQGWLIRPFLQATMVDRAIIIISCSFMLMSGTLNGIVVCLVLAAIQFLVYYSRSDFIKCFTTGAQLAGTKLRNAFSKIILLRESDSIFIFILQGYLFFGNGNVLVSCIRDKMEFFQGKNKLVNYLLIDFEYVLGVDDTFITCLFRLLNYVFTTNSKCVIVFTNILPKLKDNIGNLKFYCPAIYIFEDLDSGLNWCNDDIIIQSHYDASQWAGQLESIFLSTQERNVCNQFFTAQNLKKYGTLYYQGQYNLNMYYLKQGSIKLISADTVEQNIKTIKVVHQGFFFGLQGILLGIKSNETAIAMCDCEVLFISHENLVRLEKEHANLAINLYRSLLTI